MTEPTREQLDNLLDRATDHQLTHGEVDRLRAGITGLRQQLDLILAPIPALIAERDHHAAAVQRVRAVHHLDHLYEVDCPCPIPGEGDDDAHDDYWDRHFRADDGDVACLDRPTADVCRNCMDEYGDPHPWPCPTGAALDAEPDPAADSAPLTDHQPKEQA